jgi:HK97 family phage major capsid protein
MVGDGSAKPTGLVPSLSVGLTAAGAAAITAAELISLQHSVIAPYRANGVWLMKDATFALLRKLVDTTGQFLLQPGLQLNAPDVLLGRPVYVDPDVPAATTGLRSVVFGDIRRAYTIRDVNGVAFQRLEELYALNGQVGFRANHRTDGKLMNTAAIKYYANSAT